MKTLNKIDKTIGVILWTLSITFLIVLFLLLALNVFFRFFPIYSMGWFDEIVEFSFAWMCFIGAAALWRECAHCKIDFLCEKCAGKKISPVLNIITELIALVFVLVFTVYGTQLVIKATAWSPIFRISRKIFYVCVPISGTFMAIYSIKEIIKEVKKIISRKSDSIIS